MTTRHQCPVCGKHPTLTKGGTLHNHTYPWYHSQSGDPCPGSGTPIGQLPIDPNPTEESQ